jgi:hypothetical protein
MQLGPSRRVELPSERILRQLATAHLSECRDRGTALNAVIAGPL